MNEMIMVAIGTFLFSTSVLLNLFTFVLIAGLIWYIKKSVAEVQSLENRNVELENWMNSYSNLEQFLDEVVILENKLVELRGKSLFLADPDLEEVHQRLMNLLVVIEGKGA